jgi:hypothetical protein
MSALFLEVARTVLFFPSSPRMFRLRKVSSMVVLAPLGEVAKTLPVVMLATHKLIVSVDAVVGVELLGRQTHLCLLSICKDLKALSQTIQG